MVTISHIHTLPPTNFAKRSYYGWVNMVTSSSKRKRVCLLICHFGSFRNSIWLLLVKKIWQPCSCVPDHFEVRSTWSPVWGGDQCLEWTTSEKWEGIFCEVRETAPWCPPVAPTLWELTRELQLQGRLKKCVRYNLWKFFTHVCWEANF